MKYLEHILKTYVYTYCNMCNIPIYFCNIDIKYLQHTSQSPETLETYVCNVLFRRKHLLAATKARRRVEVTDVLVRRRIRARWGARVALAHRVVEWRVEVTVCSPMTQS